MSLTMNAYVLEERDIDESMMFNSLIGELIDLPSNHQEICHWRRNYKLNEFISNHIYTKRNIENVGSLNGSFLILTYQDILLIEKNIKEIESHSYVSIDTKELKKKNKMFLNGAKAALESGKVVVYRGHW